MSVMRRSAGADWLDRLADYLAKEERFTADATIPDGASTVDGLRVAADELEGAVARADMADALARLWLASPDPLDQRYGQRLHDSLDAAGGQ
jgi:hypothetical protein